MGHEPTTSRLEVWRAIHCATRALQALCCKTIYIYSNMALNYNCGKNIQHAESIHWSNTDNNHAIRNYISVIIKIYSNGMFQEGFEPTTFGS